MTTIDQAREILRNWMSYRPVEHHGQLAGYRLTPIPVDDLTDDELLEIVREISTDKDGGA